MEALNRKTTTNYTETLKLKSIEAKQEAKQQRHYKHKHYPKSKL